jgi:hypothetical protein
LVNEILKQNIFLIIEIILNRIKLKSLKIEKLGKFLEFIILKKEMNNKKNVLKKIKFDQINLKIVEIAG